MKCKHADLKRVFTLGRQSNGNQILWCSNCGSAQFGKNILGPIGPPAKWHRPRAPKARIDWHPYAKSKLPPWETLCAVQFADGSVSSAVTSSTFALGLCSRRVYFTRGGKRMRQDIALPSTPIRFHVVPRPEMP